LVIVRLHDKTAVITRIHLLHKGREINGVIAQIEGQRCALLGLQRQRPVEVPCPE
jgi:hypothetical protein